MPLTKLRRSFEERRTNLIEQLDKNRKELDLSQQHQIFGAIKEIENFLKSIDEQRTLEAENNFDIDLSQEREWPMLQRTQRIMKKGTGKAVQATTWTFYRMPVRVGRHIKGKIEAYQERRALYKQVRQEVERRVFDKK